jgi:hypothetical protein
MEPMKRLAILASEVQDFVLCNIVLEAKVGPTEEIL